MDATPRYDFKKLQFRGEGGLLIPLLQKVQTDEGYISRERIAEIHRRTGVPLSQIFGVATFYAQFRLRPVGRIAMSRHCWVWTSARRYRAMGKRKVFGLYVRNFWSEILRHRPADRDHLDVRA